METAQTVHPLDAPPPSFETVWASLQELSASQKETDRLLKETAVSQKETERMMKAKQADFNARIGNLTNLFGEVSEYMIAPKLCDKFAEMGLVFPRANRNVAVNDRGNGIFVEIDIMLENGDKAMLVEVKTKLTAERVNKHMERLEKMRAYASLHGENRVFLGAVAGVVATDEVKKYGSSG